MHTAELQRPQTVQHEQFAQPELPGAKKESIFAYYDVPNEINFVNSLQEKVPVSDRRYLIQENVYRFLGEFAGKVPYTTIAYTRTNDGLSYAGIDLMDSYRKTAQLTGPKSREEDELVGYEKIAATIAAGATSATWISPPTIADYGIAFHFQRDPTSNHVKEYVLRYDEKRGDLSKSAAIQRRVAPDRVFDTDSEYLQNPHIGFEDEGMDISHVMESVGIAEKDIHSSQAFEQRITSELSPWVDMYADAIEAGEKETAEYLLTAIFNRAVDIKKAIEEKPGYVEQTSKFVQPATILDSVREQALLDHYSKQKAEVTGGSCPVAKNKWGGDPFSSKSITEQLKAGTSINQILKQAHENFVCPRCMQEATGPVGNECPHCHLTKEEFAEEGGTVC